MSCDSCWRGGPKSSLVKTVATVLLVKVEMFLHDICRRDTWLCNVVFRPELRPEWGLVSSGPGVFARTADSSGVSWQ